MKALRVASLLVSAILFGVVAGALGRPSLEKMAEQSGVASWFSRAKAGDPAPAAARSLVTALGRLEPESQIIQVSIPVGGRVERLAEGVKEGAWVAKNDPLAYLDSYKELSSAKELAQSQLDEAQERLKAETTFGKAGIEVAKLKIRHAEEVLPKQIEAQEAEVRRSRADMDKWKIDLRRSEQMLGDRAIPQSQHDTTALAYRQSQEHWESAKATLAHLKTDQKVKVLVGKADLESAKAGLTRAELSPAVASLTRAVRVAQARLDQAVIKAPIDGEVIKILTRSGESGPQPLLKLGNTKTMYAVAEVYETDVRFVQVGQKATVRSRAFPDEVIPGVVERVGSLVFKNDLLSLDPARDADTRIVEVRVRLDDSKVAASYNQLQVDVEIQVSK